MSEGNMEDSRFEHEAKINLRDCQAMSYQNSDYCANCYQDISTGSPKKFSDEMHLENTESGDATVTLVEALNLVFDLHKKSHLTSIILDENKYSLCRGCYVIFVKLFQIFSKFSDVSSPPSYLFSIFGRHPLFHQFVPLIEIKTEDEDIYSACLEAEGVDLDEDISTVDEIFTDGINYEMDVAKHVYQIQIPSLKEETKTTLERKCKVKIPIPSFDSDVDGVADIPGEDDNWDPDFLIGSLRNHQFTEKTQEFREDEPTAENTEKESKESVTQDLIKPTQKRSKIRAKTHICKECNIGFTRSNHLKRHMQLHSCKEFTCECGVGFKSDRNLKYHQKFNCRNNPNAIIFTQPELPDPVERALKIARKKQAAKLIKNAKKKPREPKSFVCPHSPCGRVFSRKYRLKRHETIHLAKPHLCKYCHNSYRDEETLSRHIKTTCRVFNEGGQLNPEEGENPEEAARRLKVLDRIQRKRVANNTRRYVCHCGESFSRTNHLRTHSHVHKEKNYTCRGCGAGFVTEIRLQKHLRIHDPDYTPNESIVKIRSIFDGDGQLVRSALKKKKSKKDGKELATCDVCGKSVSARNLKIHMISHMGDRPMVCELCGHSFKTIWSLKCHQKYAHGTERPFLCKFCGRAFKRNQHMVDHEIVAHSDNRAYVCKEPNCDKSFKSARNLRQHRLLHKGVKFDCSQCGSRFSRKDNLKVHVEKHCGKSTPIRRRTVMEAKQASYITLSSDMNDVILEQECSDQVNPQYPSFETDMPVDSTKTSQDSMSLRHKRGRPSRPGSSFKQCRKTRSSIHVTTSSEYHEDRTSLSSVEKVASSAASHFYPLQRTVSLGSSALSSHSNQPPRTTSHSLYGSSHVLSRIPGGIPAHSSSSSTSNSFPLNVAEMQQTPLPFTRPQPFEFANDAKQDAAKGASNSCGIGRTSSSSSASGGAYDLRDYDEIQY